MRFVLGRFRVYAVDLRILLGDIGLWVGVP